MVRTICLLFILLIPSFAQTPTAPDWNQFNYFIGSWQGPAVGQWGSGKCDNQFQFVLNGTYLEIRHRVITPPQEKNPKGEVHQDFGLVSYDKARGKFTLRQFHVEGFVNQYVLSVSPDHKALAWETEAIENIAPGWRAKQTWKIVGPDEWVETFELAPPGKEFIQGDVCTYTRQR